MLHRVTVLLAVLAGLFVVGPAAAGPELVVLEFPREGFSIARGAEWTFAVTDGALLELRRGKASLWIRRDTSAAADPATRLRGLVGRMGEERAKPADVVAFSVKGGGEGHRLVLESDSQRQGFAFVAQPRGRKLEFEWVLPAGDAALLADVEHVLASLDVTPYENPRRHVDWKDGWSIDVPSGWKRMPTKDGRTVFASDENPATLLAVRRATSDPAGREAEGVAIWAMIPEAMIPGGTRGGVVLVEERSGWWVTVLCPDLKRPECKEANASTATFRRPPDPGPRAGAAAERFERADAPKVTFMSPARWKKVAASPGMRLAQYQVPGEEPAECVVFFFGAAQGGTLEANLERWTKQFVADGPPQKSTEEVAPGVFATVLDISGRYVAETRPGSGVKLDKPDWRMLAAVVLAPDGPLYLKLVGPKATIDPAAEEFRAWVRSFRVAK